MADRRVMFLIPHHYDVQFEDGFPYGYAPVGNTDINSLFDGDPKNTYDTTALAGETSSYICDWTLSGMNSWNASNGIFIENHNMSSIGSVYLRVYYDSGGFTEITTGPTRVWGGLFYSLSRVFISSNNDGFIMYDSLSSGYDTWRLSLWASTTFSGELAIGQLWHGTVLEVPPYSHSLEMGIKYINKKYATSLSGTKWAQIKDNKSFSFDIKTFKLIFESMTRAETADFLELFKRVDSGCRPFKLIIIEPDNSMLSYTVAMTGDMAINTVDRDYFNITLQLEETS
jgi:hypothetical protein